MYVYSQNFTCPKCGEVQNKKPNRSPIQSITSGFLGSPHYRPSKPDSGKTGKSDINDTSRDTPEDDVLGPEDEPDDVTVEPSDDPNGPDNPIVSLSRNQQNLDGVAPLIADPPPLKFHQQTKSTPSVKWL